ncbi:S26 family signal peptidase [archaeon]|jgi:signal peptidase I|nr:S26 family signal peptidase [archaeon]MBT3577512.1 S26 family signal peptidase [archaeon]MBT6820482.1 S26 family signal peptidase [archaeon]MBT6955833.1 S26 family signal peptidase [archaeon]MBT7025732.1 S26 family signal peptidase [archaeon]
MNEWFIGYGAVFLIGFLSCAVLFYGFFYLGAEMPLGMGAWGADVEAPSDYVGSDDVFIRGNEVVLRIPDASLSRYAPTGSMRPVLDVGTTGVRIIPQGEDEISVGDIVTFQRGFDLIVHRVIEKGTDSEGIYFVTKGDNSDMADGKIRFEDIRYKTIALIY